MKSNDLQVGSAIDGKLRFNKGPRRRLESDLVTNKDAAVQSVAGLHHQRCEDLEGFQKVLT